MSGSNLLTVAEVVDRLGSTERTIRRYIANGLIPVKRYGPVMKSTGRPKNVRVDAMDLEVFIRSSGAAFARPA